MNILICTSHAPWKAEFHDLYGWRVLSAREEVVSYIPQSIVHDEANARLIASAPELLAALNRLVQCLPEDSNDYPDSALARQVIESIEIARAIISKAKGGQE